MSDAANSDLILQQLANAAQLACWYASCFPPSAEIAEIVPRGVGGPVTISAASENWRSGATLLEQVQQQLTSLCSGLPEQAWSGDDRAGFDAEVRNLTAELGDSHNTAEAVGIALEVLPPVLAVWPAECLTIGLALAAVATSFYVSAASGIGDITGEAEAVYAMGLEVSEMMLTVMTISNTVLIGVLAAVQAVIAGAVATDTVVQDKHGDHAILGDLAQAEVDGLGQVAANVEQLALSQGLSKVAGRAGGEDESTELDAAVRKVLAHGGEVAGSTANEQTVDRTHTAKSLQELINDATGWDGD